MPRRLLGKKIKTFNIIRELGAGAFATVFQAIDDTTSKLVAVKVIEMSSLSKSKKLKELVQTEITVLKACKNENVIAYVDSFQTRDFLFLVTEFCSGGDLENYIAKKKNIPEDQAVGFLKEILNGFKGLHEVGAMHRDFKAANVLLHEGVCKIADLGFSKQMEENSIAKTILGTSLTMAPEVLEEIPYTFSADIWSIGVVFYQMIFGVYPFTGPNDFVLLKKIKTTRPSYTGINISKNAMDFIQKCLTVSPQSRITWKQIYQHPLISQKTNKILTPGVLKSKLSMNKNRTFYQNILQNQEPSQKSIGSLKRITLEILPDDTVQEQEKVDRVLGQAAEIKRKEEIVQRFDNLYVGRRNDLMFFQKFVEPYLPSFQHVKINHHVIAYLMVKKSYIQISKLHDSMKNNKLVFYGQNGFQQYLNSPSYKNLLSQLQQDLQSAQSSLYTHKSRITLTTKQIQAELSNPQKILHSNYENLLNNLIQQYVKLLAESFSQVHGVVRNHMIMVREALNYYKGNSKPAVNQFDRIVAKLDYRQCEDSLIRKCGFR